MPFTSLSTAFLAAIEFATPTGQLASQLTGADVGPSAGPPVAAPVATPPVPAPVAGPPVAAAEPGDDATPSAAEVVDAAVSPVAGLPTAAGLTAALDDAALANAELVPRADDRPVFGVVEHSTTMNLQPSDLETVAYPYDDAAYDELYDDTRRELRFSGYGGVSVRGSTIMHNPAVWVGGRGGVLIGDHLSLGGAFYQVSYRHGGPIVDPAGRELGIRAAYGGAQLGYRLVHRDRFAMDMDMLIGGGAACISGKPGYQDSDWRCIETVKMFVTEPGISARFNVMEWFRLGVTAGYRFATRQAWRPPNDFQVSGPYVGLDFDFGWFQ